MTFCCFNSYLLLIVQKWFFARPIIDPVEVNKYHVFSVHFYLEISPSAYVSVALSRFGEMNSQTNIVKIPIYSTIQKNIRIIGEKEKTGFKGTAFPKKEIEWLYLRQKKSTLGEHLALLSVKYNVYPNEVFQALVLAKKNESAKCGCLVVEYRGKMKEETIFLITKDGNVVAQFRVEEEFLLRKDNPFESWMSTDKIKKKIAKQNTDSSWLQVKDLRQGMKRVNLKATVDEIPKPAQVHTQFGNTVLVVNAIIGDDTGKIKLCLWDTQIGQISVGETIELKNGQVCVFRGEKQLRLGKNGSLSPVKPQIATA